MSEQRSVRDPSMCSVPEQRAGCLHGSAGLPARRAGTLGHTALSACERGRWRGWDKEAVSRAGISSWLPLWSLFLLLGLLGC